MVHSPGVSQTICIQSLDISSWYHNFFIHQVSLSMTYKVSIYIFATPLKQPKKIQTKKISQLVVATQHYITL